MSVQVFTKSALSLMVLVGVAQAQAQSSTAGRSEFLPKVERAVGQDQKKITVGISTGFADTQGRRAGTTYGGEVAHQPVIPFGLGVSLNGYVSDHGQDTATLTRTKLMAKGTYNFGGNLAVLRDSYVGLGIGPVLDNERNRNDVNFGVEPTVGFDIPLSGDLQRWSLGANANYLFVGGAKADVFAANGVAKYMF